MTINNICVSNRNMRNAVILHECLWILFNHKTSCFYARYFRKLHLFLLEKKKSGFVHESLINISLYIVESVTKNSFYKEKTNFYFITKVYYLFNVVCIQQGIVYQRISWSVKVLENKNIYKVFLKNYFSNSLNPLSIYYEFLKVGL